MHTQRILTAAVMASLVAATAHAQPVTCGFDSPGYHLGALSGQNGWISNAPGLPAAAAEIVTSPRFAGNQAARFDQSSMDSDTQFTWTCNAVMGPGQTAMDVEWEMSVEYGSGFGWVVDLVAANGVRLGWLWIDGPNIWYRVWGAEPLPADGTMAGGVWSHFRVALDWQARTTVFFLNGQIIATSGWHGNPTASLGTFGLRAVSAAGTTDVAGLDSISVTPSGGCPADVNRDGVLNSQDFFDFINSFFAQRPEADFNTDGAVNSQDFFDFLAAFFTGCQ